MQKKISRLASIEGEGESTYLCSDQDSVSIDNEVRSREETALSDDDAEIVDLMNKVELMKKERSVLWLREFKEWMDHASDNVVDHGKFSGTTLYPGQENMLKTKMSQRHVGESMRYVSDSVQALGDETSTNILDSESSYLEMSTGLHAHKYDDQIGLMVTSSGVSQVGIGRMDLKDEHQKTSLQAKSSYANAFTDHVGYGMPENASLSPLTTIGSISESHSSAHPGSPPHYRKDILQRRQCLEEEILQLSADSYSVASSDSNTSCSEDDAFTFGPMSDIDQLLNEKFSNKDKTFGRDSFLEIFGDKYCKQRHHGPCIRENGQCSADPFADNISKMQNVIDPDQSRQSGSGDGLEADTGDPHCDEEDDLLNKKKGKIKTKRWVVLLPEDNNLVGKIEPSQKSIGDSDFHGTEAEKAQQCLFSDGSQEVSGNKQMFLSMASAQLKDDARRSPVVNWRSRLSDEFIEDHFYSNLADSRNHETCWQYIRCYCILESDSLCKER